MTPVTPLVSKAWDAYALAALAVVAVGSLPSASIGRAGLPAPLGRVFVVIWLFLVAWWAACYARSARSAVEVSDAGVRGFLWGRRPMTCDQVDAWSITTLWRNTYLVVWPRQLGDVALAPSISQVRWGLPRRTLVAAIDPATVDDLRRALTDRLGPERIRRPASPRDPH